MVHQMGINHEYFEAVKTGEKIVEVRLNDFNKQKINVGDTIEFINFPNQQETLRVEVVSIKKYETFTDLFEDIPLNFFTKEDLDIKDMLNETYDIYNPELEEEWGVLAIIIQC